MAAGVGLSRGAVLGLLTLALVSCRYAMESGSTSPSVSGASAPSPTLELPSARESPAPSATTPPDFTVSWTEVPWSGSVRGVTFDSELGIWLAFGTEEMWTSADGSAWDRHTFQGEVLRDCCPPQPAWMRAAVRMGNQLWAAGVFSDDIDGLGLLMWTSTDASTWEIVAQGGYAGFYAHAIASDGSTLAVANTSYFIGQGEVLTSMTGTAWTSHVAGSAAAMLDLYGDVDGFVAVGYRGKELHYAPAFWASADGSNWLDSSPQSALGQIKSVVRAPDGTYIAAGLDARGLIQIWQSDGAGEWEASDLPGAVVDPTAFLPSLQLVASGNRLVLLADTAAGWSFWTSRDGRSWSAGQSLPADGGLGPFVAIGGNRVVAFIGHDAGEPQPSTLLIGEIKPVE